PGIPDELWADAGARFSQRSGVSPESAGLGLAIVDAVARAHGGRLAFSHAADGTFVAALDLPAAAPGDVR
ncbi:MAG: ATP-binding protein, partial [Alphaproteobacteria bacterium]